MHSSRMRTAHLLPISPSMHCSRGVGVPVSGGTWSHRVYLPGGVPAWGVYLHRGCTCLGGVPGPRGLYPPGECSCLGGTWSWGWGCTCLGVYLVPGVYLLGGVPTQTVCVPALGVYLVPGCTCLGDVPGPRGCTCPGVYLSRGYLVPGGTFPGTPLVNRMTNRCKNITLPQTSFTDGNKDIRLI